MNLIGRPHVVILGAGASLAAFPNGDQNGIKLPLMNNLVETVRLQEMLDRQGVEWRGRNFEEIYSELHDRKPNVAAICNQELFAYFAKMEIPCEEDSPATLYDHLILSLRSKDVIATFNWDPFLFQALHRCRNITDRTPCVLFLHGNVAVGYCDRHSPVMRLQPRGTPCGLCGDVCKDSPLLFPVKKKGYMEDPSIRQAWIVLQKALDQAFVLTIFGYGAPDSDADAIELMKKAWGSIERKNLEQVEIVDILHEDTLLQRWRPFIHTHHYSFCKDFYKSLIGQHPRRSCESEWERTQEIRFDIPTFSIPRSCSLHQFQFWLRRQFEEEWEFERSS